MKRMGIFIWLCVMLSSSMGFSKKMIIYKTRPLTLKNDTLSSEDFKEKLEGIQKLKRRKIAATDTFDESTALSVSFRNIRNHLIGGEVIFDNGKRETVPGAKSAADINGLLLSLENNLQKGKYDQHPDARLLAAQLLMLRPLRGFIARSKGIFSTKDGNARTARGLAITLLRLTAAGIDTYLPTEQWSAAFDYVTQPFYRKKRSERLCQKKWHDQCDMTDGPALQAFLINEIFPRLENIKGVLAELTSEKYEKRVIYWDNKLLFGSANFVSHKDRYLRLGQAERLLMLSATQATQSSILGMNAYHINGFFETFDTIGKKYGIGSVFQSQSATAQGRFEAFKKPADLFRFKTEKLTLSKSYMKASYDRLKASMQNAYLAWQILDAGESSRRLQNNLIDPRLVVPFRRVMNNAWPNALASVGMNLDFEEVEKGEVVSSVVNGEKVVVSLKKFFDDPPKSLKVFMPTGFIQGDEFLHNNFGKYRNYRRGNPKQWNVDTYGKYFEGVRSSQDVKRIARVLSQSWGGFLLGLPLGVVMM